MPQLAGLTVRNVQPSDAAAIDFVHRAAFPTDLEARLVALLVERGQAVVSLVAEVDGRVAGHILFSPASVGPAVPAEPTGLGLAPLAVLPEFQRRGIGSALVHAGLADCRRLKLPWVIVLGDPAYYSRFGFAPAIRWQLTSEFGGDEAFQFLPLTDEGAVISGGIGYYAAPFRDTLAGH